MYRLIYLLILLCPLGVSGQIQIECDLLGSGGAISEGSTYRNISAMGEAIVGRAMNGLDSTEIGFVFKAESLISTAIHSLFAHPKIKIYPNPSTGAIQIEADASQVQQYHIWNAQRRMIQSGRVLDSAIELSSLPSGTYFLRLYNRQKKLIAIHKFIKL